MPDAITMLHEQFDPGDEEQRTQQQQNCRADDFRRVSCPVNEEIQGLQSRDLTIVSLTCPSGSLSALGLSLGGPFTHSSLIQAQNDFVDCSLDASFAPLAQASDRLVALADNVSVPLPGIIGLRWIALDQLDDPEWLCLPERSVRRW